MEASYKTCLAAEKFQSENGLLGMRDENGNIIEPTLYSQIEKCRDYIFFLKPNGDYYKLGKSWSESYTYFKPEEIPYIVDGKFGYKNPQGNVILEPIYDCMFEWGLADVLYAEKGDEYFYFNKSGERILTEVRSLNGVDPMMPYYFSEEQNTGQLVVREIIDSPKGNRCCKVDSHWEQLDRIALSEVPFIMQGGELIRMPEDALDDLLSPFAYIYSAYIAKAKGNNCLRECLKQFIDMGCYLSSWGYITRVWIHPETTLDYSCIYDLWHSIRPIGERSKKTKQQIGNSFDVGVGFDSALAHDEMKIMQVLYHSERFPMEEEWELKTSIHYVSLTEIKKLHNIIEEGYKSFRGYHYTPRQMAALKKEMLLGEIPSGYSSPRSWDEEKEVYEYLYDQGYGVRNVLTKMLMKMTKWVRPFSKEELKFIRQKIGWLLYSGADVNAIVGGMTVADILERDKIKALPDAQPKLEEIQELIKSYHPKHAQDFSLHRGDLEMIEAKAPDINWQLLHQMFPKNESLKHH